MVYDPPYGKSDDINTISDGPLTYTARLAEGFSSYDSDGNGSWVSLFTKEEAEEPQAHAIRSDHNKIGVRDRWLRAQCRKLDGRTSPASVGIVVEISGRRIVNDAIVRILSRD